jgi:uncharacterized protein (TIGR01777 family)
MQVAVTGATGFVGRALCAELRRGGHQVVVLSRDPAHARELLPEVEAVAWNAREPPQLPPVDSAVHLAGESLMGRWSAEKKRRIRESRVEGTRSLVKALGQVTPRPAVLVSMSAVGYYGDRGEELLTEASPPGSDFLAKICHDWELEAQCAAALDIRVVRLRAGAVLDRGGGALAQMLLPFRLGLGGPLGSGRQWFPWIHRDDVVGLALHALQNRDASGPINAVAPETVRNREFTRALGRAVRRPALLPAPAFALRLLLGEMADLLLGSQRVIPERAQATGYSFRYPRLDAALQAALHGSR